MAGSDDYRSSVLQATDIVDLIGRTVALKRRGRDYVGLCPFHQEKTPSFTVKPDRQYFYCFGCKEKGNAIDFVIKRDRVEFIDALKQLGQAAGIEMPRFGVSKEKTSERQGLLEAHSAACSFFEKLLSEPAGGAAGRDYLSKERGFTAESIQRFQIGLAADAWEALIKGPVGRKFKPELLALGGLVKKREKGDGYYDTFRNRLMFPIRDESGRVIAFGGRKMPGSEDPAKYLNSPETPLFSKSRCLFGIDVARQKIVETRAAVVVEGYTDVVMAHQFGASNVVSPLGTALTDQHVSMLRRFADRIVLWFDADVAGDAAVDRAVGLFLTQPVEIAIASMPEDLDPDEFLLKNGLEAFEKLMAAAPDALTYKWNQLSRRYNADMGDLTGQQKAVEEYLGLLAAARAAGPVDSIRWGISLARVSRLTDVPIEQLNHRFGSVAPRPRFGSGPGKGAAAGGRYRGGPAPYRGSSAGPRSVLRESLGPPASGSSSNEPPGGGAGETPDEADSPRGMPTARNRAERWILGTLLLKPSLWRPLQRLIGVQDFMSPVNRRLADAYWNYQRDEGEPVFNEFLGLLGEDGPAQQLAIEALQEVEALDDPEATLADAVRHIEQDRQKGDQRKLVAELRRTSDVPLSEEREIDLLRKLQDQMRKTDVRRSD